MPGCSLPPSPTFAPWGISSLASNFAHGPAAVVWAPNPSHEEAGGQLSSAQPWIPPAQRQAGTGGPGETSGWCPHTPGHAARARASSTRGLPTSHPDSRAVPIERTCPPDSWASMWTLLAETDQRGRTACSSRPDKPLNVCTCLHARTHTRIHRCTRIFTQILTTRAHTLALICTHICLRDHAHTGTRKHAYMYTDTLAQICTHILMHTYTCPYT